MLWITCPHPHPQASIRLFCFSYAGGSARIYQQWGKHLEPHIEICLVELPGHGLRITEPPIRFMDALISSLGSAVPPWLDKPFACFGHSLGGLVAFELTRWLRRHSYPAPKYLCLSAARAPHLRPTDPPIYELPRADFINELRRYNGTPDAILENAELMDLLLPALRADFALLETYQYQSESPLPCPIIALWGDQDDIVRLEDVTPWQVHTASDFSLKAISGDHFFIHQQAVLRCLPLLSRR